MRYKVSYKRGSLYHDVFVEASSAEIAEDYVKYLKSDAIILGVNEATDDMVSGNPVIYVNEAYWNDADFGNHTCSTCREPASGIPDICPFCLSYMK